MKVNAVIEEGLLLVRDLLQLGPSSLIGIDIGLHSVKIAELDKSGEEYTLKKFAIVPLPEGAMDTGGMIEKRDEVIDSIGRCLANAEIRGGYGAVGLAGPHTEVKRVQISAGTPAEIDDEIHYDIETHIQFKIDEAAWSYNVVGENQNGSVEVMLGASRQSHLDEYKSLVEEQGVKVRVVDLTKMALVNTFLHTYADVLEHAEDESQVLLNIGANRTEMIVVSEGSVIFNKDLAVGGAPISAEIQRRMGVTYAAAEDLKITGDDNGNLPEEVIDIIDEVLKSFFGDIKRDFDHYMKFNAGTNLREVYITGGSAMLPGLRDGLEELLSVDVKIINPFDRIIYNDNRFTKEELNMIAYQGSVAIGLAMRDIYS
ncbi:MAG: type IV pilus assembly protein PilM [Bdellovibrionales bacterium]|nr:type IV pilus assembly protein PilM [Bdellovibrionales bacterium]MBT3526103.1 type IV pilus assembly protein PilM [Bdellovibrionales bacterium]MBT7670523.1 type IV pilus assembly protein PilM [Bdellovibrionales bacterium]MBT7766956.1 type IV pilus assembly protein PilM [Bdellovibrionales bacterium]